MLVFLLNPTKLFKRYLQSVGRIDELSWQAGQLAVAMEIITQIKMLEDLKVMSDEARAEAVSALQTLMKDCGLHDPAWEMYERLNEWRKPKFVAERPVLEPSRNVGAGGELSRALRSLPHGPSSSVDPGAPVVAKALVGMLPSSQQERLGQEQDSSPSPVLEEPSSSGAEVTSDESRRSGLDKAS